MLAAALAGDDRRWLFPGRADPSDIAAWLSPAPPATLASAQIESRTIGAIHHDAGEISYFVLASHRSRGIGTAMVAAWLAAQSQSGETPLLTARVARENIASRRVLEANGFAFVGLVTPPAGTVQLRYVRHAGATSALLPRRSVPV